MSVPNNTQYIIQKKLGEGGMGTVYLAEDTLLERQVAIKELNISTSPASEPVGNRFQQEALALARLNHPNITHLYSFLPKDDTYWMVMEYVNGKTLEEWLQRHGPMQPVIACSIAVQILDGLHHAHRKGIIHRDLKPANVMISEEGEVKIMDFGIARIRNSQRITQHGKSVGTLEYMAPEQIQGKEGDERTDIYATGNILYELLCGQPPFRSDTDYILMKAKLEETPPLLPGLANASADLRQSIFKALSRNPEKRYETVSAFREALNKCMHNTFIREHELVAALNIPAVAQNFAETKHTATALGKGMLSSNLLTNLSFQGQRLSKFFSGKKNTWNIEQSANAGGFFTRMGRLITNNAVAFLLIVVVLCGALILWTVLSENEANGNQQSASNLQDSADTTSQNSYIIENQLSQNQAPLTVEDNEPVEETDEAKNNKPPSDKSKKPDESKKNKITNKDSITETPANPEPVTPTEPEPAPPPARNEPTGPVTIPAGRSIYLVLDENLSSEQKERDGDVIRLHCKEDVQVGGKTIIKRGAVATGKIVDVLPSDNKRKKAAMIGFVITRVEAYDGTMLKLSSERFQLSASSPGTPAVYRSGQEFSAKLGRGRLD